MGLSKEEQQNRIRQQYNPFGIVPYKGNRRFRHKKHKGKLPRAKLDDEVRKEQDEKYRELARLKREKKKEIKHQKYLQHKPTSNGELKIIQFLERHGIKYEREYRFEKCKNPNTKQYLLFDFYLPIYATCIEFDGAQHFKVVKDFNQTEMDLINQKYRDKIKDYFCESSGLKMIRIPFHKISFVDSILKESLLV